MVNDCPRVRRPYTYARNRARRSPWIGCRAAFVEAPAVGEVHGVVGEHGEERVEVTALAGCDEARHELAGAAVDRWRTVAAGRPRAGAHGGGSAGCCRPRHRSPRRRRRAMRRRRRGAAAPARSAGVSDSSTTRNAIDNEVGQLRGGRHIGRGIDRHGLGEPRSDVGLASHARRAEVVDGRSRRRGAQVPTGRRQLRGRGRPGPEQRVVDDVLGVGHRPDHPVGERHQVRSLAAEGLVELLHRGHRRLSSRRDPARAEQSHHEDASRVVMLRRFHRLIMAAAPTSSASCESSKWVAASFHTSSGTPSTPSRVNRIGEREDRPLGVGVPRRFAPCSQAEQALGRLAAGEGVGHVHVDAETRIG